MKKKIGNCDQCHERHELSNELMSTFHRCFKYRNMPIVMTASFHSVNVGISYYLCKNCILDVMRAIKNGDNWK